MTFFTPELYLRFNSRDSAVALTADAEWERAIAKYNEYLATFRDRMPSPVEELSELCLHDGEILQREERQHPLDPLCFEHWSGRPVWPFWYGLATLGVRLDDILVTLFYFLCDHVAEHPAPENWPFSREREHWLYDEVHWQGGPGGRFTHVILLSSGVVVAVPFSTVVISRFPLAQATARGGKQTA